MLRSVNRFPYRPGRGSEHIPLEKPERVEVRNGREMERRRFERLSREEQIDELIRKELAR